MADWACGPISIRIWVTDSLTLSLVSSRADRNIGTADSPRTTPSAIITVGCRWPTSVGEKSASLKGRGVKMAVQSDNH